MKKSTLIANFVIWALVAFASIAFLAWYHTSDANAVAAVLDSFLVGFGVIMASPLLLYAIGAILGLLVVHFKRISFGRGARIALRVLSALVLAYFAVAAIQAAGVEGMLLPTVILVYVTMTAPMLIIFLGFVYALGCAPLDPKKRGPFADYLPDDHFE